MELCCLRFLPANMLEIPINGSFTLPKAHCRVWTPGSTILPADSSWYFKGLSDKYRFLYFKGQDQQLTTIATSQGLSSPPKPGLLLLLLLWNECLGWLLQPRLDKQLPSDSSSLSPPSNLWQIQGHQDLTAEATKFSLASPAEKSCSSSDPTTLSSSSSYMWFPCGSLQGVWSKEQSPREWVHTYLCLPSHRRENHRLERIWGRNRPGEKKVCVFKIV